MRQAALAAGRAIRLRIHVTGLDAMCRMIDNGLGVGVMPRRAFELMRGGIGSGLDSVPLTDAWAAARDPAGGPRLLHPAGRRAPAGRPPAAAAPTGSVAAGRTEPQSTYPRKRPPWHARSTTSSGTNTSSTPKKTAPSILYIDRHLVHEVTSPQAFEGLREAGRKVWRISSVVATADHNTPTTDWELRLRRHHRPDQQGADHHAGQQHRASSARPRSSRS